MQRLVRRAPQRQQIRRRERRARLPHRIVGHRRGTVVRAHLLADVAAVGVGPDGLAHLLGNAAADFDGEIRQTAPRVEHTRLDQRTGRTGVEAACTAAALLEPLGVRFERERRDDLAEKEPRPQLGIDQAGVLADPAEPGVLRIDPLLYRSGVHERAGLERLRRHLAHPVHEAVVAGPEHAVVVVAPCVPRHLRGAGGELVRVRAIGVVERAGHDDAARARQHVSHVAA